MTPPSKLPKTIVLVHGLWMTPRCWEAWIPYYQQRGFKVLAPAWPGLEVEVEAIRADPSILEKLDTAMVAHHFETIVRSLESPPIIIGHSMGGALTQILLDRGLGAAGVAIDSVQVKGVLRLPLTTIKSVWPILRSPANRHRAVAFSPEEFHYAFTNTLSREESDRIYDRYAIPCPGRMVFEGATANFRPQTANKVDFEKEDRAPLLFIAGSEDHIMPARLNRWTFEHYKSGIVGYHEFAGRDHWTCGAPGWEAVADYALEWALDPVAATTSPDASVARG
ncbi:MAG: alpha/beta hydrolase [Kofleriaceae bacterium]|nr:alpha/beta hydrolase [Kofleriaceae bacterium]